jgi:phospholipase A1
MKRLRLFYLSLFASCALLMLSSGTHGAQRGTQSDNTGIEEHSGSAPASKALFNNCLASETLNAEPSETAQEITAKCQHLVVESDLPSRLIEEQVTERLSFVITPHRRNYILPFTHQDSPNNEPWVNSAGFLEEEPFEHAEVKLQISFKVPLSEQSILYDNDGIYFGFTMKSFWQMYNQEVSAPFRETNYRPELFYQAPIDLPNSETSLFLRAGLEHESNGRTQLVSRSWNRVYLGIGLLRNRWAIYLQPWYRLPESAKEDDGDPSTPPPAKGDDNPDISDYYGHFELLTAYEYNENQITSMVRFNHVTHKGAFELGYTFPLYSRLRGFVQYFDGYGESLIDYDHRLQRIGIGVLLTDLL